MTRAPKAKTTPVKQPVSMSADEKNTSPKESSKIIEQSKSAPSNGIPNYGVWPD